MIEEPLEEHPQRDGELEQGGLDEDFAGDHFLKRSLRDWPSEFHRVVQALSFSVGNGRLVRLSVQGRESAVFAGMSFGLLCLIAVLHLADKADLLVVAILASFAAASLLVAATRRSW